MSAFLDHSLPYYSNTVPDLLNDNQLRSLLQMHSLPTDGDRPDLRARLQQKYLNWQNPSHEELTLVRSFFTQEMTREKLMKALDLRGLKGHPDHRIEDLRRILTIFEMKKPFIYAGGKRLHNSPGKKHKQNEEGSEGSEEESDEESEKSIKEDDEMAYTKGSPPNAKSTIMSGGLRGADPHLHGHTEDCVISYQHTVRDTEANSVNVNGTPVHETERTHRIEELEDWTAVLRSRLDEATRELDYLKGQ